MTDKVPIIKFDDANIIEVTKKRATIEVMKKSLMAFNTSRKVKTEYDTLASDMLTAALTNRLELNRWNKNAANASTIAVTPIGLPLPPEDAFDFGTIARITAGKRKPTDSNN
mmetsp:Transcript_17292/g.25877  ORF Transcript_17292/g.25877 Transcript_17292/m.25877 type:complete len:112 (-) Transcript_17292:504-839(-)